MQVRTEHELGGGGSADVSLVRSGIYVYSHFLGTDGSSVAASGSWVGCRLDSSPNHNGDSRIRDFSGTALIAVLATTTNSSFLTRPSFNPSFAMRSRMFATGGSPSTSKYAYAGFFRNNVTGGGPVQELIGIGVQQGSLPQNYRAIYRLVPNPLEITDLGVVADTSVDRTLEVKVYAGDRIEWLIDGALLYVRPGDPGSNRLGFGIGYTNTSFADVGSCSAVSPGCLSTTSFYPDWVEIRDRP